jgi:hypothetical protein
MKLWAQLSESYFLSIEWNFLIKLIFGTFESRHGKRTRVIYVDRIIKRNLSNSQNSGVMREVKEKRATAPSSHVSAAAEARAPELRPRAEAIREQMERLLSSARLAHSPRCQSLLRHIVETSLRGHAEDLKERNLGILLYKRDASYDTYADPVVRMAMSELRKKLAQYYYEPENQGHLRIEIPTGSYVPEFSLPESAPVAEKTRQKDESRYEGADKPPESSAPAGIVKPALHGKLLWMAGAAALLLAICAAALIWHAVAANDAVKEFWAPIIGSPNPVLLCLGESRTSRIELNPKVWHNAAGDPIPFSAGAPPQLGAQHAPSQQIAIAVLGDMSTMADIAVMLRSYNKRAYIQGEAALGFEDLQKGPGVLMGAFNNEWTIQLTRSMRFRFDLDAESLEEWIADEKNPGERLGLVKLNDNQSLNNPTDYALVARILDSETKQPLIIAAGITPSGTRMAGEYVIDRQYLSDLIKTLPVNWQKKNLEVLLTAKVIDGQPGPPHVVASVVW